MKFLFFTLILCINIASLYAQSGADSVRVLPIKADVPANAKKLGSIKVGNHATKLNCDYDAIIADAKQKASKMGGNLVKIIQMNSPVFISKCYSINADVYYVKELPDYDLGKTANMPETKTSYATVYIYRLADTTLATGFKLHLNDDSVLCSVKSKSTDSFNVYQEGTITLWAETEKRRNLKIDIKLDHNYYVRCGLQSGEIRMIPVLQLMDNTTGKAEYAGLRRKKKGKSDIGVKYLQQIH